MPILLGNSNGAANLTATVTTSNGITGNGSPANPVQLGGTVTASPVINISGSNQILIQGVNGLGYYQNIISNVWEYVVTNGTGLIGISIDSTNGIFINDNILNNGIIGQQLYNVSNPKQFAQYGNIPNVSNTPKIVKANLFPAITSTTVVFTYTNPGPGINLYRLNTNFSYNSGTGTAALAATGIDAASNAYNIARGSLISTGSNYTSPLTIAISSGSTMTLTLTITGTVTAEVWYCLEQLPYPV